MKSLREYIEQHLTVFHGDDYETTVLNPQLMNNGNNQCGIGIYFASKIETARFYGRDIVKAVIDTTRFVEGTSIMTDSGVSQKQVTAILVDMWKVDPEAMYYLVTDYGIGLYEIEDVTVDDLRVLGSMMMTERVQNFQIILAETFGVVPFVKSWNNHIPGIHGTYENQPSGDIWFAIINTNIQLEPVPTNN